VKHVWSRFALSDRDDIFSHIEAESPRAAGSCRRTDRRCRAAPAPLPDSGRPGRIDGTRELVIPRTPYVAAYLVDADTVRILRVLHGAQMWPDEFPAED
jgi:addiction module RelE/StbE family toxin